MSIHRDLEQIARDLRAAWTQGYSGNTEYALQRLRPIAGELEKLARRVEELERKAKDVL